MADIVKLAEAVAAEIGAEGGADVMFAPELDLKGIRERRIIVVPSELGMKPISRGSCEDSLKIQVGVLKKCTEDEIPGLIGMVEDIGRGFLDRQLAGAICTDAKYTPLYYPDHFRERRQFTGVVELTFKSVTRR